MSESKGLSFKAWRILFLLLVLVSVILWGWNKERTLQGRTDWEAPLRLGIVVVEERPVGTERIAALRDEATRVEAWFRTEMSRYRGDVLGRPVLVEVVGPTPLTVRPPQLPDVPEFADFARFTYELWEWTSAIDGQLAEMPEFDSTVYLIVRPATMEKDAERFFEGLAEQGGEMGIVEIDLAEDMVHLAMMTSVHEFLHTIGATDKYHADGTVMVPRGLADPDRYPRFPQVAAEVMGRNVVLSETKSRLPENWSELVVGSVTAQEIGWIEALPPPLPTQP